jgi:hypothetical protein
VAHVKRNSLSRNGCLDPGYVSKLSHSIEEQSMLDHINLRVADYQYYGAFVLDPDGYNIEAVCHRGAP